MSSTSVVATVGHATSTPRGPAIDVFNFDGGRCRKYRQHPQGARRRCLGNLVPATRIFLVAPTRGATTVNITTTSKARVSKKNSGPCGAKNPRIILPLQKFKSKSTNRGMPLIIEITKRGEKAAARWKVYASSGSRSNRSATARAASSTPSLAASADSSTGPCTAGSMEMVGSRLRKHINTWSATAYARAQPSSSRRPMTTSSS
jgi:hypothetical protein